MPTRFYFHSSGTSPLNSLAFDSQWEQTGEAVRRPCDVKAEMEGPPTTLTDSAVTIPITTTQQVLHTQFVSRQIFKPIELNASHFVSAIVRGVEAPANNVNAHLAMRVRAVSAADGRELGGVFASSMTSLSELPITTPATRLIGNNTSTVACTAVVITEPWRLVFELGVHLNTPLQAGTATLRIGCSAASDFAFTTALTTDLNPWFEISAHMNALGIGMQHLGGFRVGEGMSTGERVR